MRSFYFQKKELVKMKFVRVYNCTNEIYEFAAIGVVYGQTKGSS